MICEQCGGNRTEHECKLCELFATGQTADGQLKACWPMESIAMGVHPKQVEAAKEAAKRAGVPTEFTKEGRPIIRSALHQKQYAKTRGMHNHDNFY